MFDTRVPEITREACSKIEMFNVMQAMKEEEEMLMLKRQMYMEEMNENEHQQQQMELCGQGLELKLRDQGMCYIYPTLRAGYLKCWKIALFLTGTREDLFLQFGAHSLDISI